MRVDRPGAAGAPRVGEIRRIPADRWGMQQILGFRFVHPVDMTDAVFACTESRPGLSPRALFNGRHSGQTVLSVRRRFDDRG